MSEKQRKGDSRTSLWRKKTKAQENKLRHIRETCSCDACKVNTDTEVVFVQQNEIET